jgi:hypothetical protein
MTHAANRSLSGLALALGLGMSSAHAVTPDTSSLPLTLTEDQVVRFVACLPSVLAAEENVERLQRRQPPTAGPPDPVRFNLTRSALLEEHAGRAAAACGFADYVAWQRTRIAIRAALTRGDPLVMGRAPALARLEY